MPPPEELGPLDASSLEAIVRLLMESWPVLANLTSARLGLAGDAAFLETIRALGDAGLISCEAIREGEDGPEVIGAALTARGRARFGSWAGTA